MKIQYILIVKNPTGFWKYTAGLSRKYNVFFGYPAAQTIQSSSFSMYTTRVTQPRGTHVLHTVLHMSYTYVTRVLHMS